MKLSRHLCFLFALGVFLVSGTQRFFADENNKPFGIDKRVAWTGSRITGSPEPPPPYEIERMYPGLTFHRPVEVIESPESNRLFVVEVDGSISSFVDSAESNKTDLAIDLRGRAQEGKKMRVYSLTFHPEFQRNRFCYICYILGPEIEDGTRVSRFTVNKSDPPTIDPESEKILITWKSGGHNGCCLKFGPDGYLYISTGDGGPAFPPDPLKSGQDVSNLLSSVLRIDVDHPSDELPYTIPSDNPFVELDSARGEVWAYGMRNPWRMSFDPATGHLWVGDVGWEMWEMIYRVQRGGNYGWSLVEGSQPVHRERTRGPTPILPPTIEHSHIESRSITGGLVYRGKRLKALAGSYVYGDYVTGKIWGAKHNDQGVTAVEELVDTSLQIICFGTNHAGELLIVDYHGGVYRLVPNPTKSANLEFPKKLSDTGLFGSVKGHKLADGVISYSINAEPWMDGATAERFVAIPGKGKLGLHESSNVQIGYIKDTWRFPTDSVLGKTISLEMETGNSGSRRRIETQIFHFDKDTWRAYTYIWNDEQSDAVIAPQEGENETFRITDPNSPGGRRQQSWRFASRNECLLCHSTRGGSIYGFNPAQMNRLHDYGSVADNQLRTLAHIGLFEHEPDMEKVMPSPLDESVDLEKRARAYLHVNCAHCHRRGGGGTAAIELPYEFTLERTHLLDARPTQGTFGIHGAQVLAPGDPFRSVLYYRMAKLGRGRMPYFGSTMVDERGLKLMHDWISQLTEKTANEKEPISNIRVSKGKPADQQIAAIDNALSSTSGALSLLYAVDTEALPASISKVATNRAISHKDITVRDLFERFVPEEKRTKRLGTAIDAEKLLALKGDSRRGRKLFLSTAGVQCKNCHRIGRDGKPLGPDLTQIGKKYDRAKLLESILQPSKAIDPKFVTYLVETTDGRVVTGLLVKRNDEEVVLKDAQHKEIRLANDQIEFISPQQKSIMPELLLQDMTAEQVADLLEFLVSLR